MTCWACGSTATKVQKSTNKPVCPAHEYACKHGKDPCNECDSE